MLWNRNWRRWEYQSISTNFGGAALSAHSHRHFSAGSDLSGCMIAEALADSAEKGVCRETRSD